MLAAHPREEEQMKRVLATLVALSLVMSMFTGVFAPVPEARAAGPATVNLLSAGNFVVLAETAITTTGATHLTGDIGVSPAAASYLTGFALVLDGSGTFSTSSLVTGKVYAADYTAPTPINMGIAVGDMYTAYTDAAGRPNPTGTELGAGNIGGFSFIPGIYKWSTNVTIPTDITLSGGPDDVWIFQIAGDLNTTSKGSILEGVKVNLVGGAQASNIFWQVQGSNFGATLGTYSTFNGNILSAKQIIMQTGAVLNGRALAQTQVTLDGNTGSAPMGSLQVTKIVNWNGATPDATKTFSITVTGPSYLSGNTKTAGSNGGNLIWTDLLPGSYTVIETNPGSEWTVNIVTSPTIVPTGGGSAPTVTVTNTHIAPQLLGSLQVTKIVNWNGATPDTTKTFAITVTGPSYLSGNTKTAGSNGGNLIWTNLLPGSYTVTETNPGSEWTVNIIGSPASVTAGGQTTVTVTNTHIAPQLLGSLQVTKIVNWNGITPDTTKTFAITVTGPSYLSGNTKTAGSNGGNLIWTNLLPGSYTVTETNPGSEWTVNIIGSPASVTAGGQTTVTVTNTNTQNPLATGTITVIKHTIGGDGTFQFTVAGGLYVVPPITITTMGGIGSYSVPVIAGSYTVTEGTLPAGWISSDSDMVEIAVLLAGGTSTVEFHNTGAPVMSLRKSVSPTGAVFPGARLTYTLSYSNTGTALTSLTITDRLDDWLDEATLSIGQRGLYNSTTRIITWNVGPVLPGGNGTVTFSVNVRSIQNMVLLILNTGLYTATPGGPGQSNTVETPVLPIVLPPEQPPVIPPPPPSIAIDVTAPAPLCVDAYLPYKICFTNGIPPYKYTVDFGDGTPIVTGTTSSPCVTLDHAYLDVKQYSFYVTVHDSQGMETTHQETFTTEDCTEKVVVYHHNFFIGYPDGTFQPDGNITRAEISAAMSRALGLGWSNEQPGFPDVKPTHWAAGFITLMKNEGFMLGDPAGTFRPDAPITRAEAAAVFLRIAGMSPVLNLTSSSFSDVEPMSWAAGYIEAARQAGLLAGYPDNTFRPADLLSRAEFATLASDALGRKLTSTNSLVNPEYVVQWPDVSRDFWAYDYISEVTTPHTVTNPTRLTRIITLKERKIPLFTEGDNGIVTFLHVGDTITAIVPVDGLQPDGSDPAPRTVKVRIINHERP